MSELADAVEIWLEAVTRRMWWAGMIADSFRSNAARHAITYIGLGCIGLIGVTILSAEKDNSIAVPPVRILFVGNSLTSANDLPGILANMAKARGHSLECDMHSPGGYRFSQHAIDAGLKKKINKGTWDFVVLQEQSQLPALGEQWLTDVFSNATKLCQIIRQANPKAQIAFYMTMAKKNGDPDNVQAIPEIGTYAGMQDRLIKSYTTMAQQNNALLIPAGTIWKNVRADKPTLELYGDVTHPNVTGTYLVACAFYAALFKDTPVGLTHPRQVGTDIATYLQNMTAREIRPQPVPDSPRRGGQR